MVGVVEDVDEARWSVVVVRDSECPRVVVVMVLRYTAGRDGRRSPPPVRPILTEGS